MARVNGGSWGVFGLLLGAVMPAVAHAQSPMPEGLTLAWDAPGDCPDRDALAARIQRHLPEGKGSFRSVRASGRVTREAGRYRLELSLSGRAAEAAREATAVTCEALTDLAALLVSLALDPAAQLPEATPVEPPAQPPASPAPDAAQAPPNAQPPAPPVSAPAPPDRSQTQTLAASSGGPRFTHDGGVRLGFDVGLAGVAEFGMLPQRPAFAGAAEVGVRLNRVRLAAAVVFWPYAGRASESYPSAQLEGRGLLGRLWLRAELVRSPLSLAPGVGVERGELALKTLGISAPGRGTTSWTALGAGLHAGYRIWKGLELGVDLLGMAPLSRPSWFVRRENADVIVFSSSAITAHISLGISYIFD